MPIERFSILDRCQSAAKTVTDDFFVTSAAVGSGGANPAGETGHSDPVGLVDQLAISNFTLSGRRPQQQFEAGRRQVDVAAPIAWHRDFTPAQQGQEIPEIVRHWRADQHPVAATGDIAAGFRFAVERRRLALDADVENGSELVAKHLSSP